MAFDQPHIMGDARSTVVSIDAGESDFSQRFVGAGKVCGIHRLCIRLLEFQRAIGSAFVIYSLDRNGRPLVAKHER